MIQIFIDNKLVDLDNTNISLQKEFSDEIENIVSEIEYSYTVSIPATMNNKEIFGFADVFDVANKFKRLYNADLYVDEVLVLSGKFKVTSIEEGYYKGNIYNPKKKTISEILGDKNLNEIKAHWKPMNSLEDFDKINNYVCGLSKEYDRLPNEWNGYIHPETVDKNGDVKDNHVVYPYMLYGLPMNNPDEVPIDLDIYTQDLQYGKHSITENYIYPSFNVVSVLKDIFKTEGYNLTGNIIDGNMKDFFGGLYQTFQYSHADYVQNKEVPFYLHMEGQYTNWCKDTGSTLNHPSPSIEIMDLGNFDEPEWTWSFTDDDAKGGGNFQYGVDDPWLAGASDASHTFNKITKIDDDFGMFAKSSSDKNAGIIIVPKTGWYKINLKGSMEYPYKGNQLVTGSDGLFPITNIPRFNGDILIGGTTDEADNTTLAEMPFEIQLKRGTPKDYPKLYSFNSFVPCNAVEYYINKTVAMEGNGNTYLKLPDGEAQRRYGKNGSATYIKQIGDYNGNEFICGARLGGAWTSSQWGSAYHGEAQRKNRSFAQIAGLALPNPSKTLRIKHYNDEPLAEDYKAEGSGKFDGYFMQLADKNTNYNYEYGKDTAQCLVRYNDAYSNFLGYNTIIESGPGNYRWDTTTNYGAVSWTGADNSTARTTSVYAGQWDVNTCVWLEKGDTLYLEFLMPLHNSGRYEEPDCNTSSEWWAQYNWINATKVNYNLSLAFQNGNKDWVPRAGDGIGNWNSLSKRKLTNVNQFLPSIKCNDYLEKFLKTFNLQLTSVDSKTYSIDTITGVGLLGNVIDIDKMCNIDEAEFKPLKSDSIKEYKWKIDTSETGYAQGNQSPHKGAHAESPSNSLWYDSGYTGSETIENDTNSSGSVKKTEAPWSYNWYKTIHFLHNYVPSPLTEEYADIGVISDIDLWKNGMTFAAGAKETPKTTKTMRLFALKKNPEMNHKMYSYISFKFGEKTSDTGVKSDQLCNLVLPSNYFETKNIDNTVHRIHLDYGIMNNKYDGKSFNNGLMDIFFNKNVQGGYDIEIPIKLSNTDYANTKIGTMYKLNDGLYKVKSIEGHDVNKKENATLTLTTLK